MANWYKEKRAQIEEQFKEENKLEKIVKETSLSGKHTLEISYYTRGEGTWDYSRGIVRRGDHIVADVKRNYSSFPFAWVENHANGHEYLICGEDYQGQTVIELDTGERREDIPPEAEKGYGFCWADYKFDQASSILVVEGCFWACPYEFRFYDFSDPMNGWPEIKTEECIYNDEKWPEIGLDGTIRCFETGLVDENGFNNEDETVVRSIKTFRRDENKLLFLGEWVSDAEKESRQKEEQAEQKYRQWREEFKATDPLYLAYASLVSDPRLNPEEGVSTGITYTGWCPDFKEQERRWCRRILQKKENYTVDLEWAVKTGPIKLVIYNEGKHVEDKFFAHSAEGMDNAFAYVKSLIT